MIAARCLVAAASIIICAAAISGKQAAFSSRVTGVRVDVLVSENGAPVTGLTAADFEVRDNGVVQDVDLIEFGKLPLNVIMALDLSQSTMGERLLHLRLAARARDDEARVRELLDLVGLGAAAARHPTELAHGDQRHLEIALALAPRPRLLLLDEPTAGMSLAETGRTTALVRRINRESGVTVVIVEHDMKVILELAQRITVLDRGRVLAEGGPREVAADERVRAAYLGRGRHAPRA